MVYEDAKRNKKNQQKQVMWNGAASASLRSHGFATLRRPIVVTGEGKYISGEGRAEGKGK
jgi:hypothetical protein